MRLRILARQLDLSQQGHAPFPFRDLQRCMRTPEARHEAAERVDIQGLG